MQDPKITFKDLIDKYPELWRRETRDKGYFLFEEGTVAQKISYLESGTLKVFCVNFNTDKEGVVHFFFPGDVAFPYNSFTQRSPTLVNIEVLNDAVLWSISKENWEKLKEFEPEVERLLMDVVLIAATQAGLYMMDNASCSNLERYERLCQRMPQIKNINNEDVVSYLGISTRTLNEIRAEVKAKSN